MKNRKLFTIIIALFVFFSISISAFAINGNYDMHPAETSTDRLVGQNFKMELMVPNQYTSSGKINDANDQYNGKPFFYFELEDEIDAASDFNFTLFFKGNKSANLATEHKKFTDPILIYDDVALAEENIVAKGSDGAVAALEDSFQSAPADGYVASMSFYIPKGTLKEDKTYYLVFPKECGVGTPALTATLNNASAIYQIKTKAAEPQGVVPVEGNVVLSSGAEFSFDAKQVDREKKETVAGLSKDYGTGHYLIDGELDTKGTLDISVQMSAKSGGKQYCKLNAFVYDSAELSNKVLTLSESPDSGEDIFNAPKQLSVDGSKLKAGKTYYLVFAKDSKDGNQSFDEDVVFEFKMHTHTPVKVSGTAPKCETPGLTEGTKCLVCGDIIEAQEEIPPTGHQWVTYPQVDPDCTHVGYTEHRQCKVCFKTEGFKEIPALGHDEIVTKEMKAATCTEDGWTEEIKCSRCDAVILESRVLKAKGHTEEIVKGKAATCTEVGKTDGKQCSVCGEWTEAQEDIPALGHNYEVVPEVISTCTEKGSTAGVRCTRCGEYLLEPKEVPMVYHDYQNGKCTVCGAEDPNYKPEEPDEPTPVEPVTKFTGLANEADKDGVWWYYTDGKIDKTHTGVDQNKYGWWRVENGKVNFKAQGIYQNAYGWWKTTDGKVTFKENSIYKNEYGWWKCKDSKVDFNAQSIYQNQYGWWKTTDGKVTFKENGLFSNQYGTWKVENSKVNFDYNGTYQSKTIKNGKVQ